MSPHGIPAQCEECPMLKLYEHQAEATALERRLVSILTSEIKRIGAMLAGRGCDSMCELKGARHAANR